MLCEVMLCYVGLWNVMLGYGLGRLFTTMRVVYLRMMKDYIVETKKLYSSIAIEN